MATKARLHRFWRIVIAAVAGAAINYLLMVGTVMFVVYVVGSARTETVETAVPIALLLAPISGIAIYGLLTRWFGPFSDGETHCRRCDHILRGLSEPRCPECGEGI